MHLFIVASIAAGLRARSRAARLLGAPSSAQPLARARSSSAWDDASPFSMTALEEVFGPDQAAAECDTGTTGAWTPARPPSGSSRAATGPQARLSSSVATHTRAGLGSPEAAAEDAPLADPEGALRSALAALAAVTSGSHRCEDWRAQLAALAVGRRLARHHPEVLLPALHALVAAAAPVLDSLRSVPARLAIAFFQASCARFMWWGGFESIAGCAAQLGRTGATVSCCDGRRSHACPPGLGCCARPSA